MIGKKFFYFLFLISTALLADVDFFVTDLNDDELTSVAVGQPFLIHVSASDIHGNVRQVDVDGLDKIGGQRTSVSMSTFNGRTSVDHVYQATIDRHGTYTIGPARVVDQDGEHVTNALTIAVGADGIQVHQKNEEPKKVDAVKLSISTDNKQVYVGQRVSISVDLSYTSGGISLNRFYKPDYENCIVRELREPEISVKKKHGKKVYCASYEYQLFPQKVGQLVVPSHAAVYTQRVKKPRRISFLMAAFSFDASEQKQAHSNALTLQVNPLPPHNGQVDAVGRFANFALTLDTNETKQHDVVEVTLSVVGDGDLQGLSLKKLTDVDKTLRPFFSSQTVKDLGEPQEVKQKIVQYALQPTKEGVFVIPPQTFTYFDPYEHAYKTLYTQEQTLTVEKCERSAMDISYDVYDEQEVIDDVNHDDGICVVDCGPWCAPRQGGIPHEWFLFLLFLPLFLLLAWLLLMITRYSYGVVDEQFAQKNAFKRLQKKLERAQKRNGSPALIYQAFINACAKKWHFDLTKTSHKTIVQKVSSYLMPYEQEQLESFLIDALHATYGDKKIKNNDLFECAIRHAVILHDRVLEKDAAKRKNKGKR